MISKSYLRVVTKTATFKVDRLAEIDQEGSLIKFYVDTLLKLVVQTEDFIFCDLIEE